MDERGFSSIPQEESAPEKKQSRLEIPAILNEKRTDHYQAILCEVGKDGTLRFSSQGPYSSWIQMHGIIPWKAHPAEEQNKIYDEMSKLYDKKKKPGQSYENWIRSKEPDIYEEYLPVVVDLPEEEKWDEDRQAWYLGQIGDTKYYGITPYDDEIRAQGIRPQQHPKLVD